MFVAEDRGTDDVLKWQNGKMSTGKWQMARMMATSTFCSRVSTSPPAITTKIPNVFLSVCCFWEHASNGGDTRVFLTWKYERFHLSRDSGMKCTYPSWESLAE